MPLIECAPGVSINIEDTGEGDSLVLVHGWSMSGRVWRFQRELADECRLVIPDLRGHGRSSTPAAGYELGELARDLVTLFERLDLADTVLLGWSLGAQVVLAAFPAIRERLAGLILVGGTPRFTATEGYPSGLPANEPRAMGLRLKRDFSGTMGAFFRGMFAEGELSREQENRVAREIVMGGRLPEPEVAVRTLESLAKADLRAMLPDIDLPVLLIHGSRDTICLPEAARFMAERLPDVRLKMLEGVGHAPFLSHPVVFNGILRELLRDIHGRH
jgi:non-heme chloroperoxidase